MRKRALFSLFLACILVLGPVAPVLAARQSASIPISSPEDFLAFAKNCTLDTWSQGKSFYLTCDISLNGLEDPSVPTFGGTFDGQNFTIEGLSISGSVSQAGLFSQLQASALVKNLHVKGSVTPQGTQKALGGIAGTNAGAIESCTFTGTVQGETAIGGIAGINEVSGRISGCTFAGVVTGTHYTGGIAGYNSGSILGCTNGGAVNTDYVEISFSFGSLDIDWEQLNSTEHFPAHTDTGGVTGYSSGRVEGCINNGSVGYPHVGYNVGGIAGRQVGYLSSCVNNGPINGRKDVGGIVGQMAPDITLVFDQSELQALEQELQALQTLIDRALDNASGASNDISAQLTVASGYLGTAKDSVFELSDHISGFVDSNIQTVNDLAERLRSYLGRLPDVLSPVETAGGLVSDAFASLGDMVTELGGLSEISESAIAHLKDCAEHLRQGAIFFSSGFSLLQSAVNALSGYTLPDLSAQLRQLESRFNALDRAFTGLVNAIDAATAEWDDTGSIRAETWSALFAAGETLFTSAKQAVTGLGTFFRSVDWVQIVIDAQNLSEDLQTAIYYMARAMDAIASGFDQVDSALVSLTDFLTVISGIDDALSLPSDSLEEALSHLRSAMDAFSDGVSGLRAWAGDFAGEDGIQFSGLGEDYNQSAQRLNAAITGFSNTLSALNGTVTSAANVLIGDLKAINNQFMTVLYLLIDAIERLGNTNSTDFYEDISDDVIHQAREGKVSLCINEGTVDGDVNVGGIAGAMAIEYDLDPEDDITVTGDTGLSFQYRTQAILLSCINRGAVTSKKDCAGGMVGRMDLGTVSACENYGHISSASGDYVGGIAGQSLSSIRKSFAKCFLSGRRYVGGIAGAGTHIYASYTLVKVIGDAQNAGAIAGSVDGTLSENHFVSEDLAGVDRVSLSGKAAPISYEQLLEAEGLPEAFGQFSLLFSADGTVIQTISFDYGDSLTPDAIPAVPEKEGYYGVWSKETYLSLTFDEVVEAVYTKYAASLPSEHTRENGLSVLLVDGQFLQNDVLTVTKEDPAAGVSGGVECWSLSIPADGADTHQIRYRPLEGNVEDTTIFLFTNGAWQEVQTESMGSYLLFSADGGEVLFAAAVREGPNIALIFVLAAGALVLFALIAVLLWTKGKGRKKTRKSNDQEEPHEQ